MFCLRSWRPQVHFTCSKTIFSIVLSAWNFVAFPEIYENWFWTDDMFQKSSTELLLFGVSETPTVKHGWIRWIFICWISDWCLQYLFQIPNKSILISVKPGLLGSRKLRFYARPKWKNCCTDKNLMWQSALEAGLANKQGYTQSVWLKSPLKLPLERRKTVADENINNNLDASNS